MSNINKVLIFIICILFIMNGNSNAFALENAFRYHIASNLGVSGSITTGSPALRDGATNSKWSYMRVLVQRTDGPNTYYAEIGWLKGTQPESNQVPRVYWTYRAADTSIDQNWSGYPGVGISYNYAVKRDFTAPTLWGFYFNNLSTPLVVRDMKWSISDRFGSGGETNNSLQGMGFSQNNGIKYIDINGNAIFTPCYATDRITFPKYLLLLSPSDCSSWVVRGQNNEVYLPLIRKP